MSKWVDLSMDCECMWGRHDSYCVTRLSPSRPDLVITESESILIRPSFKPCLSLPIHWTLKKPVLWITSFYPPMTLAPAYPLPTLESVLINANGFHCINQNYRGRFIKIQNFVPLSPNKYPFYPSLVKSGASLELYNGPTWFKI